MFEIHVTQNTIEYWFVIVDNADPITQSLADTDTNNLNPSYLPTELLNLVIEGCNGCSRFRRVHLSSFIKKKWCIKPMNLR